MPRLVNRTVKLAGPDNLDRYRVIQVKNTMVVLPGDVYTWNTIKHELLPLTRPSSNYKLDVTIVEPQKGPEDFGLGPVDTATVRDRIRD